MKVFSPGSVE